MLKSIEVKNAAILTQGAATKVNAYPVELYFLKNQAFFHRGGVP